MHLPLTSILATCLLLSTTTSASPAPDSPTVKAHAHALCIRSPTEGFAGSIKPSEFAAAAAAFLSSCAARPRAETFPNMLDLASRDPGNPRCKVFATSGQAMLAACLKDGAGVEEARLMNQVFPTCAHAVVAWDRVMGGCGSGQLMNGSVTYKEWGALEIYTPSTYR